MFSKNEFLTLLSKKDLFRDEYTRLMPPEKCCMTGRVCRCHLEGLHSIARGENCQSGFTWETVFQWRLKG